LPRELQGRFSADGSHLTRYAAVFNGTEINSSFHRKHRASTYLRWSASVPDHFRFSVKMPKLITHVKRLTGSDDALHAFLDETAALGERLACLLIQLPPTFAFVPTDVEPFLQTLRKCYNGRRTRAKACKLVLARDHQDTGAVSNCTCGGRPGTGTASGRTGRVEWSGLLAPTRLAASLPFFLCRRGPDWPRRQDPVGCTLCANCLVHLRQYGVGRRDRRRADNAGAHRESAIEHADARESSQPSLKLTQVGA